MIAQLAGLIALDDSEPDSARVQRMLDVLDPQGRAAGRLLRRAGRACFGVVTIGRPDEGEAEAPLFASDRSLFAADARLWDRSTLAGADAPVDAEGLWRMIRWKGGAAAADIHGDFAWAHWDGSTLELGRDHFGARPMLFTVNPGRWVAFASHPDALLETGLARPAIDAPSVLNHTRLNSPFRGDHYQSDIKVVSQAQLVRITLDGRVARRVYWQVPIGPRIDPKTDPAEVASECRRLLEQAVARRMPPDGPVAGHLSGGIDSSPLAVLAARAIRPEGRKFLAYSFEESSEGLGFDLVDEASYIAELVANEPNIELHPVTDPGYIEPKLGRYATSLLHPINELYPETRVLKHALSESVDRIFSGWGGDQIVSYSVQEPVAELVLHGQWGRALAELKNSPARLPVAIYYRVILALLPERLRLAVERLTGRGYPPFPRAEHFRPPGTPDPPTLSYPVPPYGRTFLSRREMAWRNFIQHRLALFAQMGAPYGIRYVFPLLDLDLVRFAMQVPGYYLLRDGVSRRLLRDAIEGLVPERMRLREAKLLPHSLEAIRFAHLKDRFVARLDRIAPDGLAASLVDLPRLRAELVERLGTPEEALCELQQTAEQGEQLFLDAFNLLRPLQLAIAVDEYERKWGPAAWPLEGRARG